jgi:hypothetical protein
MNRSALPLFFGREALLTTKGQTVDQHVQQQLRMLLKGKNFYKWNPAERSHECYPADFIRDSVDSLWSLCGAF